jgi:4-methyl-5(b-hydroxyethyl)-thiazole monophosphate biosynthesis
MPRVVVVLAEGFEEIEAVTPIDVLRRAGVEVVTAGVSGKRVLGSHGIVVEADTTLDALPPCDAVILPGGMPGSDNLGKSEAVQALVRKTHAAGKHVAAICAAPALALARSGVLEGKRATCYPGLEKHFGAGVTRADERVVVDGKVVTSRGPGTALEFSLTLVEQLVSKQKADELRKGMLVGG